MSPRLQPSPSGGDECPTRMGESATSFALRRGGRRCWGRRQPSHSERISGPPQVQPQRWIQLPWWDSMQLSELDLMWDQVEDNVHHRCEFPGWSFSIHAVKTHQLLKHLLFVSARSSASCLPMKQPLEFHQFITSLPLTNIFTPQVIVKRKPSDIGMLKRYLARLLRM